MYSLLAEGQEVLAGIQAARMGAKVQMTEATSWLGGMLTSAGVSTTDGLNHIIIGHNKNNIWGNASLLWLRGLFLAVQRKQPQTT
ncbi:MAG: FAD-dependent oxidoreductase [Aurantibacter sp.]